MTFLDFLAETCTRGAVLGLGPGSTPDDWTRVLGEDHLDDVSRRRTTLRRDHGLVEISFVRADGDWACTDVAVQVHRLGSAEPEVVPSLVPPAVAAYGPVPRLVPAADLLGALAGVAVEPIADGPSGVGYRRYWLPASRVLVTATEEGAVWSIGLSVNAEAWRAATP